MTVGSRFFAALAYPDYRTVWIATMSAGASAWALIVARGALVFSLSGSSSLVGIVTFAAMSPQLIVPPFAGLLADKIDRRKLLAIAFSVNLLHNLVLAGLAITGNILIWHVVVLSVINGIARAIQMPAAQSLVPNLVPPDKLLNAVALNAATHHASRLLGPLLIAPLMSTVGTSWAFVLCSILYAVGLVMIMRIQTVSTGVIEAKKSAISNFFAGLVYVYQHRLILSIVVLVLFHCSLTMAFESVLPTLSSNKLGMGEAGFAYIMMAVGAGALIVVVTLAGIQDQQARGRLYLCLGTASGFGLVALAMSPSVPLALVAAAFMGGCQAGFMTLTAVTIQSIVPDGIRGRVSSIYTMHVGGMMAIFNLVSGALADLFTAQTVLAVSGGSFVFIVALSLIRAPLRAFYSKGLLSIPGNK